MPSATIANIPVLWQEPSSVAERKLVIWLPGLTDNKESTELYLSDLANTGYVALSLDPVDHGERSRFDDKSELEDGAFRGLTGENVYRHFWSILAETTLEIPAIIDWAITNLGVVPRVGMGGKSMGGDIAVATAGLDKRISVVAACIATPDWLKPGSIYTLSAPNEKIQAQYDRHNPLTSLENYQHRPAISFQCSAEDTMVPSDSATRFVRALSSIYSECPERLEVVLESGVGHELTKAMWRNSLAWFERFL